MELDEEHARPIGVEVDGDVPSLTRKEILSLMGCAPSGEPVPSCGRRTACVERRLIDLKLVRTLFFGDGSELCFSWKRTPLGERTLGRIFNLPTEEPCSEPA